MSGRLIITGKKSYCPWNAKNIERVLRDERLEAERVAIEDALTKGCQTAQTIRTLKTKEAAKGLLTSDEKSPKAEKIRNSHVNLFEAEEELALNAVFSGKIVDAPENSKKSALNKGIMPVPLGGNESSNRKSNHKPFYMCRSTDKIEIRDYRGRLLNGGDGGGDNTRSNQQKMMTIKKRYERKEEQIKNQMNPMSVFHTNRTKNQNNQDRIDKGKGNSTTTTETNINERSATQGYKQKYVRYNSSKKKCIESEESSDDYSCAISSYSFLASCASSSKRDQKQNRRD